MRNDVRYGALLVAAVALRRRNSVAIWRARAPEASARPVLTVLQALGPGPHDDGFARATGPAGFPFPRRSRPSSRVSQRMVVLDRKSRRRPAGAPSASSSRFFVPRSRPIRIRAVRAPGRRVTSTWRISPSPTSPRGRFHAFERTSRGALDLAGCQGFPAGASGCSIGPRPARRTDRAAFPLRLYAREGDVAIDLSLEQGKPIVLRGGPRLQQEGARARQRFLLLFAHPHAHRRAGSRSEASGSRCAARAGWIANGARARFRPSKSDGTGSRSGSTMGASSCSSTCAVATEKRTPGRSGTMVEPDGTPRRLGADDVHVEPMGSVDEPSVAHRFIRRPFG